MQKNKGLLVGLKKLIRIGLAVSLAIFGLNIVSPVPMVKGATLFNYYWLGYQGVGVATDHYFQMYNGSVLNSGDKIELTINDGINDFSIGAFNENNFDIRVGDDCFVLDDVGEDATPTATEWGISTLPGNVGYIFTAPTGAPGVIAGGCFEVYMGVTAPGGTNFITNPPSASTSGNEVITFQTFDSGTPQDDGSNVVIIGQPITSFTYALGSDATSALTDHTLQATIPTSIDMFHSFGIKLNDGTNDFSIAGPTGASLDIWTGPNCSSLVDVDEIPGFAGFTEWGFDYYNGTISLWVPEGITPTAANSCIKVYLGSNAPGGTNFITNPPASSPSGHEKIYLTHYDISNEVVDAGAVIVPVGGPPPASVLLQSTADTLSTLQASTPANHEIKFSTATGAAESTDTITLEFQTGFTLVSGIDYSDVDIAVSNQSSCAGGTFTERAVSASGPAGSNLWGVSSSGQMVTLTHPTNNGSAEGIAADRCVRIRIGTNAQTGVTGDEQIQNPSAGTYTLTIGGTFNSNGQTTIPIIGQSQITITANVAQTITFTLSDNTIGFDSLSVTTTRCATGDTLGADYAGGCVSAFDIEVGTNASAGLVTTFKGGPLKIGTGLTTPSNSIDSAVYSAVDFNPPTGIEQFGVRLTSGVGGDVLCTRTAPVSGAVDQFAWGADTTPQPAISTATPCGNTTFGVQFAANISDITEAGSYTMLASWVTTGVF